MAQETRAKSPQPLPGLPLRMVRLHAKLIAAVLIGIVTAVLTPAELHQSTRLLIGWNVGVAVYLVIVHATFRSYSVERIRKRASEQDEGAFAILLLTMAATIASLVAIVFELGGLKHASAASAAGQLAIAVITILLSWAFMHTIFAIHYAHEYYGERHDKKLGGLNFPGDQEPDYRDFLYFSLVVAMTSQVSDVAITSKVIRQIVSLHATLSFFFNLTILALTVNMISNVI